MPRTRIPSPEQDLWMRVEALEAQVRIVQSQKPGPFDSVEIGEGAVGVVDDALSFDDGTTVTPIVSLPGLPAPTDVLVTVAADVNVSYAIITWTPSAGEGSNSVLEYEILTIREGFGPVATNRVLAGDTPEFRAEPLVPPYEYHWEIRAVGATQSSAWVVSDPFFAVRDDQAPAAPTGVTVAAGFSTTILQWDMNAEYDVRDNAGWYEVAIDVVSSFDSGNYESALTAGLIWAFDAPNTDPATTYYHRVRAYDSSGNAGEWSDTVSAIPGKATGADLSAGIIASDHIITTGLDAAVIKFGVMSGNRIQANTASFDILTSSEQTTAILTIGGSGMIRMGRTTSPFNYGFISESGIQAYKNGTSRFVGGTATVDINFATGAVSLNGATITAGTFRTAASGRRVALESADFDRIKWYTGVANETYPAYCNVSPSDGNIGFHSPSFSGGDEATINLVPQGGPGGFAKSLVLLNAGELDFYCDGTQRVTMDFSRTMFIHRLEMDNDLALRDWPILLRNPGDYNHYLQFHSGIDGPHLRGHQRVIINAFTSDMQLFLDGGRLRVENFTGTAGRPVEASAYNIWSDQAVKANVRDVGKGLLQRLRQSKVKSYAPAEPNGKKTGEKRTLGLIAQEMPEELQVDVHGGINMDGDEREVYKGISLMPAIAYLWGALSEEAEEREALEKRLEALEARGN